MHALKHAHAYRRTCEKPRKIAGGLDVKITQRRDKSFIRIASYAPQRFLHTLFAFRLSEWGAKFFLYNNIIPKPGHNYSVPFPPMILAELGPPAAP